MQEGQYLLLYPWNTHSRNAQSWHLSQRGLQLVQDFRVLGLEGLFFLSTPLEVSRQGISSSISFVLLIIDPEVVSWQFLRPPDLLKAQAFRIYETLEVVVVCKHENFMLAALKVVPPSFKYFNNCEQLIVIGLISSLSKNYLSGEKSYQMPSAQIIRGQLTENSTSLKLPSQFGYNALDQNDLVLGLQQTLISIW